MTIRAFRLTIWSAFVAAFMLGCSSSERTVASAPAYEGADVAYGRKVSGAAPEGSMASFVPPAERSIIRTGDLTIRAKDVFAAEKEVVRYVNNLKGFVSSTSTNNLESARAEVNLTVRVPVAKFEQAMNDFAELGVPLRKAVGAEDITASIVDMEARLKVMRTQEEVYLNLLRQSKTLKDSLEVQNRLMELRQQIESLDAVLRSQSELAALSTINVRIVGETTLISERQNANWASESWKSATNAFSGFGRSLGRFGIFAAVFSPIWLPVLGFILWRLRLRRRSRPPIITPTPEP